MTKGDGKRGHNVADTLLLMIVSMLRKPGNICCEHKMFLKEIRNIFVSRTQILCPQQMLRAGTNGETFVSATMCPQHCVFVCHRLNVRVGACFCGALFFLLLFSSLSVIAMFLFFKICEALVFLRFDNQRRSELKTSQLSDRCLNFLHTRGLLTLPKCVLDGRTFLIKEVFYFKQQPN